MSKKKTILYFYPGVSSFVKKDLEIFKAEYIVKQFLFKPSNKLFTPFWFVYQLIFLLVRGWTSPVFICQFGGYHSLLPALFAKVTGKKCFIINGGTDCVSFPSISYGNFNKKFLGKITALSYRLATHLLPVHESLAKYKYTYQDADYPYQGFNFYCKNLHTPYTVIFNGYNPEEWKNAADRREPDSFITIAFDMENESRFKLKGGDLIFAMAEKFPACSFTIVGLDKNKLAKPVPTNVIAIPALPSDKLGEILSSKEFYLQLSMSEGFPNALCEAMLCGCIPIGSNVAAIPDIIKDSGFILKRKNTEELYALIKTAMVSDKPALSKRARQIVTVDFPLSRRKEELLTFLRNG